MRIPGILFTAPASGSGKTLVTCGILQALADRGLKIASFKCGPDYIDPMFHGRVIGTKSRNLDTFFTGSATTAYLFDKNASDCDVAVVEGVMGYYDGLGGIKTEGSTYEAACTLQLPAVLIMGCRGASLPVLASIKGFLEYRQDSHIEAVILNQVSPMIYGQLKPLIEQELGIKVLGYVPKVTELVLESRHLGLVLPGEIDALRERLHRLAKVLEETIDPEGLLSLAQKRPEVTAGRPYVPVLQDGDGIRIAVAQDDAFCFTYQDNLDLLEQMGAKLVQFSPIQDQSLPDLISGIILSGGYPELHAKELSANESMRKSIYRAVAAGMPCIAECGGFLYLHRELEGTDGVYYPMVGVIDAKAYRTNKLGHFGYIELEAKEDQLLGNAGIKIRGHEFHYWESDYCQESFHAKKPVGKREWDCVCGSGTMYAGFPHLFYYSNVQVPYNFLKKCREYKAC